MSKTNYQAWDVTVESFPKTGSIEQQIEFLLGFAVLAPSGHNSQPWQCAISGSTLTVSYQPKRSLADGDPEQRLLYITLGCFMENLLIAADYFGLRAEIQPGSEIRVTFTRGQVTGSNPAHLIHQIPRRHSNRYKYKTDKVPGSFLTQMKSLTTGDQHVFFIDPKQQPLTAEIMGQAQVQAMESVPFRLELSHYIKSSFTSAEYGMPGFTLDMPAPFSLIAAPLFKKINFSKLAAKKDLSLLKDHTSLLGVIAAGKDDQQAWLDAGRTLERLWLTAVKEHLALSIWAAVIQQPVFRNRLRTELSTSLLPMITFRIGYPIVQSRPSPRFTASKILSP